jgi:tyrosinase
MGDLFTSTNDPLFYLHHAGLDRLWAMWQELDTEKRLYDISKPDETAGGPPFGPPERPMTLDTPLWMGFGAPDRPVRDVMDTMNRNGKGFLCYKYDKGAEMYV